MRGCITLLVFIAMLSLPFVVLGYSVAALTIMAVIFSALWLLTKGLEALGNALAEDDEEESDTEQEDVTVRE
jgi:predicted membrane protein